MGPCITKVLVGSPDDWFVVNVCVGKRNQSLEPFLTVFVVLVVCGIGLGYASGERACTRSFLSRLNLCWE